MSLDNHDDSNLFRRMMQGVKPLKSSTTHSSRPAPKPIKIQPTPPNIKPNSHVLSNPLDNTCEADTLLTFGRDRLAHRQFLRLKQGEIPLQARTDLHGFSIEAARDRLIYSLVENQQRGLRCVLIIHGKGGQHGPYSLLKSHVYHWLKQMPEVLAFHSAQPKHGGRGAVYVLLKAIVNKD